MTTDPTESERAPTADEMLDWTQENPREVLFDAEDGRWTTWNREALTRVHHSYLRDAIHAAMRAAGWQPPREER